MIKQILVLIVLLFSIVSISALQYTENDIVSDIYLYNSSIPLHYGSYMIWDLGENYTASFMDINSIEANLSHSVVGGTGTHDAIFYLLPNQSINLTSDSILSIYNSEKVSLVEHTFPILGVGDRENITISSLLRENLRRNPSGRYVVMRFEDSLYNTMIPNIRDDGGSLYIGANNDYLQFGSSTQNSIEDYKPKLYLSYNVLNKSNIEVNPYEFRWLPQIGCNLTWDDDYSDLEVTYVFCTARINGQGVEMENMTSGVCPANKMNFTFTGDEDYVLNVSYGKAFYNVTEQDWQVSEIGECNSDVYNYKMNVPAPTSIFSQIWNTIWDTIKSWLCGIFPGLGFCS